MAKAGGRFLSEVHGNIENSKPHFMTMRNGKMYVNFIKQPWNPNKMTDTQKVQCVKFTNQIHTANNLATFLKVEYGDIEATAAQSATATAVKALVHMKEGILSRDERMSIDWSRVFSEFNEQPRDENGTREHDTLAGFLMKQVLPQLTEDCKTAVCEASGASYFSEDLDGYDAMKKAGKSSFIIAG